MLSAIISIVQLSTYSDLSLELGAKKKQSINHQQMVMLPEI